MGYVSSSLGPGEKVVRQIKRHWLFSLRQIAKTVIILGISTLLLIKAAAIGEWFVSTAPVDGFLQGFNDEGRNYLPPADLASAVRWIAFAFGGIGFLVGIFDFLAYFTYDYAVTNRRIVMKTGFIRRNVFELLLRQVETVQVGQSIFGRIMGYGALQISGTGSTRGRYTKISAPLRARKIIQQTIDRALASDQAGAHGSARSPDADPGPGKFRISGVNKTTGEDVEIHVVAKSRANAVVKADLQGVVATEATFVGKK